MLFSPLDANCHYLSSLHVLWFSTCFFEHQLWNWLQYFSVTAIASPILSHSVFPFTLLCLPPRTTLALLITTEALNEMLEWHARLWWPPHAFWFTCFLRSWSSDLRALPAFRVAGCFYLYLDILWLDGMSPVRQVILLNLCDFLSIFIYHVTKPCNPLMVPSRTCLFPGS